MSNWNLSVQLTGQGSDLANTLRATSREAKSASRDVNALKRDIGRLRAEASRDIRLRVTVDGDHLGASLRDEIRRARAEAGNGITVPVRVDERGLQRLGRAARYAGDDLNHLTTSALAASAALRTLNTSAGRAHRRLGDLSTNSRTLRGDLDDLNGSTTRLGGSLGGLNGRLGRVGSSANSASDGLKLTAGDLGLLATVMLPVVSSLVPLAAGMAAAGAGAGAFGIAIGGQISKLTEAAEAEKKYEDAVAQYGKSSQQATQAGADYQRLIAKMPRATREAAAAFSSFKDEYQDWSNSLASDTMPVATKGLQLMSTILPHLTPMVQGAADEFNRLMNYVGGAMSTPGFDRLMDKLSGASTTALHRMVSGIIDLVEAAEGFSGNSEMAAFLDYCRQNGPLVAETLKNLATAAVHLMAAAADSGVSVLTLVNALAKLVNAVPTGAISAFLQLYTALKLVRLGAAALTAVTGSQAAASLSSFVRSARFGGVGPAIQGVTQRMSSLTKVAGALGILGAVAIGINELADKAKGAPPDVDKLTTSLKNLGTTGKFTGELKGTFKNMDGFTAKLRELNGAQAGTKKFTDTVNRFTGMGPVLDKITPKLDNLVNKGHSVGALKDDFKSVDQSLAQLANNGHADVAADQFKKFQAAMLADGYSIKEVKALFPGYTAAVADLKAEQEIAAQGMGLFGQAAIDTSTKLNAQKQSADGLRQSIVALNDVNRSSIQAQSDFEKSLDDLATAGNKGAGSLRYVNGELDLHSQRARDAEGALRGVAAKTEEYATAALDSGATWSTVNGIYARGRTELMKQATAFFGSKEAAEQYVDSILQIPESQTTSLKVRAEDAKTTLDDFIRTVKASPSAKSVTVKALTKDAQNVLETLGYKVTHLKDGRVKVTALTGAALSNIGAVQAARDRLSSKSITITTNKVTIFRTVRKQGGSAQAAKNFAETAGASGKVIDYYAGGGIRRPNGGTSFAPGAEKHTAEIAPAGAWRVWAEPETGGEAYIPLTPSKRPRSRAIAEETVRRLGGDPNGIAWYADGGLNFSYQGTGGSASKYTLSGLISASNDKKGNFSLSIFSAKLRASNNALDAWRKDLSTVASRAGQDVADALAEMGDEGIALTKKMAHGSSKYIKDMASQLRNLSASAKASLSEYTSQLNAAVKDQATFQKNLATLAGQGYGALAGRLAGQNDQDAEALAAAAVKDKGKASSANKAAAAADNALSSDQLSQLVQIIAAITSSKTGIHDVAASTGLGEDDIIATATKAQSQIQSSLGSRSTKFLADLARANKHLSYADGGIRSGIYATKAGALTFAEPSTGGEAFIPLGANKRRSALPVLNDVAGRFGLGLRDGSEGRVVIIREQSGQVMRDLNVQVGERRSDRELVRAIDTQVSWTMRRLKRGGVAARGN